MRVVPVPVREDNYAYLIIDEVLNKAAVVDPYDLKAVQAAAKREGVTIIANLTTHHHFDHSGGNNDFAEAYPDAPVYAGSTKGDAVTNVVGDLEQFHITENILVQCLATPCHTQDSICYNVLSTTNTLPISAPCIFTGDTLFIAGCGRFFEGDGEQMHAALSYLSKLSDETLVYNGHEYTKSNMAFALHVDPTNSAFDDLKALLAITPVSTGKTTIANERAWNPFMRLHSPPILQATGSTAETPAAEIMTKLRELKNNFRG